jgi:tetratricopeptide (TPR) repeat protein
LAWLLSTKGKYKEAEWLYRQILEHRQKTRPPGHLDVASALIQLGLFLTNQGDPQSAEPHLREGLKIRRHALPEDEWQIASAESALGDCLTHLRRYDEAEPLLVNSFSILKGKRGERDELTLDALSHLIALYSAWERPDKAAQYRTILQKTRHGG